MADIVPQIIDHGVASPELALFEPAATQKVLNMSPDTYIGIRNGSIVSIDVTVKAVHVDVYGDAVTVHDEVMAVDAAAEKMIGGSRLYSLFTDDRELTLTFSASADVEIFAVTRSS